eukprot:2896411-Rhodomonas_salina.1
MCEKRFCAPYILDAYLIPKVSTTESAQRVRRPVRVLVQDKAATSRGLRRFKFLAAGGCKGGGAEGKLGGEVGDDVGYFNGLEPERVQLM